MGESTGDFGLHKDFLEMTLHQSFENFSSKDNVKRMKRKATD